jgi:hypothetical protein
VPRQALGRGSAIGGDTGNVSSIPLRSIPERHHWINTIVGLVDQAFNLTDDEQVFAIGVVNKLLETLNVPDRADPLALPAPLVLEMSAQVYTTQLSSPRELGIVRQIRRTRTSDVYVSVETWVEALLGLIATAYPELDPSERMIAAKYFRSLLDAIGAPDRASSFIPDDVVRVARDVDAQW